jgi:hypothetical protein
MVSGMSNLDSEVQEIANQITRLIREAYQRGEADALERVVRLARSGQMQVTEPPDTFSAQGEVIPCLEERKRAPKGTVGMMVERVLNNGSGKTPDEIKAHAVTDYERMVAVPSIRSHLRIGVKEGRYRKRGSRWYAIHSVEGETTATQAPESDMWSRPEESR